MQFVYKENPYAKRQVISETALYGAFQHNHNSTHDRSARENLHSL